MAPEPVSAFIFSTDIRTIRDRPREYVGRTVRISGEVTRSRRLPFTDLSIQTVYDGTGTMLMLSQTERSVAQRVRARVTVYGIATEGAETLSVEAVEAVERFLVEHDIVKTSRAEDASRTILSVLRRGMAGLDAVSFAVEE